MPGTGGTAYFTVTIRLSHGTDADVHASAELIDKIEVRKQVIDEDGCVEVVNERLIKIIDA